MSTLAILIPCAVKLRIHPSAISQRRFVSIYRYRSSLVVKLELFGWWLQVVPPTVATTTRFQEELRDLIRRAWNRHNHRLARASSSGDQTSSTADQSGSPVAISEGLESYVVEHAMTRFQVRPAWQLTCRVHSVAIEDDLHPGAGCRAHVFAVLQLLRCHV
jgi:hypothetical protein